MLADIPMCCLRHFFLLTFRKSPWFAPIDQKIWNEQVIEISNFENEWNAKPVSAAVVQGSVPSLKFIVLQEIGQGYFSFVPNFRCFLSIWPSLADNWIFSYQTKKISSWNKMLRFLCNADHNTSNRNINYFFFRGNLERKIGPQVYYYSIVISSSGGH